jgi:rhodanese-related sulfurtransferase
VVRLQKVLGFPDVVHVPGGMLAWVAAGHPLQKK